MCTRDFDMVQLGGPVLTRQFPLGKSKSKVSRMDEKNINLRV